MSSSPTQNGKIKVRGPFRLIQHCRSFKVDYYWMWHFCCQCLFAVLLATRRHADDISAHLYKHMNIKSYYKELPGLQTAYKYNTVEIHLQVSTYREHGHHNATSVERQWQIHHNPLLNVRFICIFILWIYMFILQNLFYIWKHTTHTHTNTHTHTHTHTHRHL